MGYSLCYDCGLHNLSVAFNGDIPSIKIVDTHPLLNPDSKHYNMFDGLESIEILEAVMTTEELMAWCRGNIYKYRLRLGNKDDVSKEVKKIQTYEAYYKYLEAKDES